MSQRWYGWSVRVGHLLLKGTCIKSVSKISNILEISSNRDENLWVDIFRGIISTHKGLSRQRRLLTTLYRLQSTYIGSAHVGPKTSWTILPQISKHICTSGKIQIHSTFLSAILTPLKWFFTFHWITISIILNKVL